MPESIDHLIRRIFDADEEKKAALAAITAEVCADVDARRAATSTPDGMCPGCGRTLTVVPFEVTSLRCGPPAVHVHADDYTLPCPTTTEEI